MKPMQSGSWRAMARTVSIIGLSVLTACASPATRFYTLGTDAQPTMASSKAGSSSRIDIRPVQVPPSVARSQLVVQVNATQVKVLEDDRWASSLPDEIRYALIAGVSQEADGPGAKAVMRNEDDPVYQVAVDVQRFESWPSSHVLVDVVWTVGASPGAETLTCHSVVSEPVPDGYQAIVLGHRHAISAVAGQIAEVVRGLATRPVDRPLRTAGAWRGTGKTTLSCPQFADGVQTAVNGAAARFGE
ncbi:PqiC family protein [Paraburkholderia sp. CNPSo 3076]|uniref:PqiC family protein n=1 Tax=Paraburkholderia sp. CNPSo 3076 TaxID=2940936 RepID=UPI00225558F4|nr:PqiC family protein [Paraburkholderia sp. CNPSo 3076]MCX5540470.1 PqiC family protein [Paraburkholderia sp. CNPSo 3076]